MNKEYQEVDCMNCEVTFIPTEDNQEYCNECIFMFEYIRPSNLERLKKLKEVK